MAIFIRREAAVRLAFEHARERFLARPDAWLPNLCAGGGDRLRMSVPGLPTLADVEVRLERASGCGTGRTAMAMRWSALRAPFLFPVLDADLELLPQPPGASRLVVTGSYRPPLGELGLLVDGALMHRVAEATVDYFVQSCASGIEQGVAVTANRQSPTWTAPAGN